MTCHKGGCLCEKVRFEALGPPLRVGICHCLHCRKHHGALFYAAAIYKANAVQITGHTRQYQGRHFCETCGSCVFATTGDEVELHLGAMDEPGSFKPDYECWTKRREAWLPEFPGTRLYEGDRDE